MAIPARLSLNIAAHVGQPGRERCRGIACRFSNAVAAKAERYSAPAGMSAGHGEV